jgi:hypothetical protein
MTITGKQFLELSREEIYGIYGISEKDNQEKDEKYGNDLSDELEKHPVGIPRARGLRGCLGD